MIFIVSGDGPRCGSTMMLKALKAGGMSVVYEPEEDEQAHIQATDDYHPNPDGIMELSLNFQRYTLGFPQPVMFAGRVFKCFPPPWGELLRICANEYRLVWLHRPKRERFDSFYKFHEKRPLMWDMNNAEEAENARDARARETLGIMHQRRDVAVTELEYHDILADPVRNMERLVRNGWPINVRNAAGVVDPSRCRFGTNERVGYGT